MDNLTTEQITEIAETYLKLAVGRKPGLAEVAERFNVTIKQVIEIINRYEAGEL